MTDYSNASRTMMYNIHTLEWDKDLLRYSSIPESILPKVVSSSEIYGEVIPSILGNTIPIAGCAGDQHASLFGQTCFEPGTIKNTYCTGCFMLMNTGNKIHTSKNGLLTTIAWGIDGKVEYALEGSIFVAGSAIQWLRDNLKILDTSDDSESIARSVTDSGGVYVVPAFAGLGAPYWDMHARGIIIGITHNTTKAHIVRATLESIAYQTKDVFNAMEYDSGIHLESLKVDGGTTLNNLLMQFQAGILGIPVKRSRIIETTALGAEYFAGLAVGIWHSKEDIKYNVNIDNVFVPNMSKEKSEILYNGWCKAIKHSMHWLGGK